MHKLLKHQLNTDENDGSDGYFLLIVLISAFLLSTVAIMIGLGFALIAWRQEMRRYSHWRIGLCAQADEWI